jgi:hypothetical protein
MQRTLRTLGAGLVLGFVLTICVTAQAEVWYVPSSSWSAVPVSRPVVATHTDVTPAYLVPSYPAYVVTTPVVYAEPVYVSRPVFVSQPVPVYRPLVSTARVTREEFKYRPGHSEYEQKGKFQAFDGRRVKTYRYEYEVDQRPWRTKVKFKIDD